jgi:hypothetical protein
LNEFRFRVSHNPSRNKLLNELEMKNHMHFYKLLCYFIAVLFYTSSCQNITANPVLGIVVLQKDEGALLSYWLEYHSRIVPLTNILVLDNYSEAPETIELLKSWATKGLHVLFGQGPYTKKGELTSQAYHRILRDVDVIIPLDMDELLFAYDGEKPVISKRKILSTLNEFWTQQNYSCLALQQYYVTAALSLNDTVETVGNFTSSVYDLGMAKKLGKAREIVQFDHGNHHVFFKCPNIRANNCQQNCSTGLGHLGLLHYHVSPEFVARRAVLDCVSFGYLPRGFTLEKAMANIEMVDKAYHKAKSRTVRGGHKLEQLWRYIHTGPAAFLPRSDRKLFEVGTLPEIIRKIESS